ncbi:MAG: hypothetical protein PHD83_03170, partial [Caldisericia bacterium]|nr:hypothetical protein [Caldisericia bacterium]
LIIVLLLEGCSLSALPKNEKVSAQIPVASTSPSALVCINGKAVVLEMNGTLTDITSMHIINKTSCIYQNSTKRYFILQNVDLKHSLWVYDKGVQTLACLVPEIQQIDFRASIDFLIVTNDEQYLLYKETIYTIKNALSAKSKVRFKLYSIKDQQPIKIPSIKDQTILEIKPLPEPGQFLFITNKKGGKGIYQWNVIEKNHKLVAQVVDNYYSISRDGKWLVALENNNLVRYSLVTDQKEIILEDMTNSDFAYVGNESTLLVCRYTNPPETVVNTMTPDKQWKTLMPDEGSYSGSFTEINPSAVYLKTYNEESGENKIILWYPDRNVYDIVFETKTVGLSDTCTVSENGNVLIIKGYQEDEKVCLLFVNVEKKTCQISPEIFYFNPDEASNDNSIWLYHEFNVDYSDSKWTQDLESAKNNYFLYNLNENKRYPLISNTKDHIFKAYADNNGDYVYIYLDEKDKIFNVRTGQEFNIPGSDDTDHLFTFITWLD